MPRISDVFQVHETGKLTSISVNPDGVTDYARFEQCCGELMPMLEKVGCRTVRFDVDGIPFMASGVIGLLVSFGKRGTKVQMHNPSPHVRDVLHTTKLDKIIEVI